MTVSFRLVIDITTSRRQQPGRRNDRVSVRNPARLMGGLTRRPAFNFQSPIANTGTTRCAPQRGEILASVGARRVPRGVSVMRKYSAAPRCRRARKRVGCHGEVPARSVKASTLRQGLVEDHPFQFLGSAARAIDRRPCEDRSEAHQLVARMPCMPRAFPPLLRAGHRSLAGPSRAPPDACDHQAGRGQRDR